MTRLRYSLYIFLRVHRLLVQTGKTVVKPVFTIHCSDSSGFIDCMHKQGRLWWNQSSLFTVQIPQASQTVGINMENCCQSDLCYSLYRFLRAHRLQAQTKKTAVWPVFAIHWTDSSRFADCWCNREDCSTINLRYSLYWFLRVHGLLAQTERSIVKPVFAIHCTDSSGSTYCWHKQKRL